MRNAIPSCRSDTGPLLGGRHWLGIRRGDRRRPHRAGRAGCLRPGAGQGTAPGRVPEFGAFRRCARSRSTRPRRTTGPRSGLFDFHVGPDVTVLTGLRARRHLADQRAAWPLSRATRSSPTTAGRPPLREHPRCCGRSCRRPGRCSGPTRTRPAGRSCPSCGRSNGRRQASGATVVRPDLNVTFTDGPNAVGVRQNACALCGDCCSGCNYGAKNTVLMNYLPDALLRTARTSSPRWRVRSVRRCAGPVAGRLRRARRRSASGPRPHVAVRHGRRRRAGRRNARVDRDPAPLPGPGAAGVGPARARVLRQRRRARVRLRHRRARARRRPRPARAPGGHGGRARRSPAWSTCAAPDTAERRRADHRGRLDPGRARRACCRSR